MSYGTNSFGVGSYGAPSQEMVGPSTHTATGTLVATVATIASTASKTSGAVTHSASGALAAAPSAIDGAASRSLGGYDYRIAVIGDSNASGRGANNQTAPASGAYLYNNAGSVVALADPWDGGTNTYAALNDGASAMGSFIPGMANSFSWNGKTTLWVPANKGGTATLDWARSLSTTTCYGAMKARIDAAGGVDKIVICLGANDGIAAVSQASFVSRMNQLVADLTGDFPGAEIYLQKIQDFTGYGTQIQAIRAGVQEVWEGVSGVKRGADLAGVTTSVHYTTNGELAAVASRTYSALMALTHSASGSLISSSSVIAGESSRSVTHSATASLLAGSATVSGSASHMAGTKTAQVTLVDSVSSPHVGLTGLKWAWFDGVTPDVFIAPTDQGIGEITDGSGVLVVDIPNSAKSSGQIGWLIVTDSDGTTGMVHKAFSGPVMVN